MRKFLSTLLLLVVSLFVVFPVFAQERPTIAQLLTDDPDGRFTSLLSAIDALGMTSALDAADGVTVLAPTNDAFAALADYLGVSVDELVANTELLTAVLPYHVVPQRLMARNMFGGISVATLEGEDVTFGEGAGGRLYANDAQISDIDNLASNGVVQVIEGVLVPPSVAAQIAATRVHLRIAHLSADAGAVDVYVNGTLVAEGVTFGTVSEWMDVPSGEKRVAIVPTGTEPGDGTTQTVEAGTWVTLAAVGSAAAERLQLVSLVEDFSPLGENQARIAVFHGIEGQPAVDVLANGSPLIINLAYPGTQGSNDGFDTRTVPAGEYALSVVPFGASSPVLLESNVDLEAGVSYLVAAAGTPSLPSLIVVPTTVAAGS